ncbi:MAG: V-type ATPase subunit [Clostridia bacterium]|nr:V-type ATPase subunit [Clostridia bacterium]
MAESLINSIARLRVLEKGLLTRETVGRLKSAKSFEECLRILGESGWGTPEPDTDEIDSLTDARLRDTYALMDELMPKRYKKLVEVFRMRHDLTNIKLLYKLRLRGVSADAAPLDRCGAVDGETLKKAVARGDYSMLPKRMEKELEALDVDTYRGADPARVSYRLDSAFIEYAAGSGFAFAKQYFGALADFTNILGLVRGVGADMLLPCGELDAAKLQKLKAALAASPEKAGETIKGPLESGALLEAARAAVEDYAKTGRVSAIENARDEYLLALASERKSDIDSPAPIVGFMLAREREAEVVRLILTAKRSGMDSRAADERSVALYG